MTAEQTRASVATGQGTGGDAAVAALQHGGVEIVFGIPGGHNIDLFDALSRSSGIRTVQPRHEQGAGFMADGYARVSRRSGVVACLEGPGMCNAMTALGEAYSDSSPVLAISSQVESEYEGLDLGLVHEMPRHLDTFKAVTGHSRRAESVPDVANYVTEGLSRHQGGGRPAPVHVEIPCDVLAREGHWELSTAKTADSPLPIGVDRAAELITAGNRPVILAGGGASRGAAELELRELAEHLGAPVLTTALGKGSIPEDHELYVASASLWSPWLVSGPVADLVANADPLIVVGSRLTDASTANWQMPQPKTLVRIDVDPHAPVHHYRVDAAVTGEASETLRMLRELVPSPDGGAPRAELVPARQAPLDHADEKMGDAKSVLDSLSELLGPDTIVMGDSLIGLWAATAWRTNLPRRYHVPMHFNTLGFALPSAIGARLAEPESPVVAIAGDGAFMFTIAELSAAVQEDVPVIAVVFNDHGYESIRRQQQTRFNGRTIAVDLHSPDFVAVARALGAEAFAAEDAKAFPGVLKRASATGRPALIEVPLSVAAPWED